MKFETINDAFASLIEDALKIEDEDVKIKIITAADAMLRLYENEKAKIMKRIDDLLLMVERMKK